MIINKSLHERVHLNGAPPWVGLDEAELSTDMTPDEMRQKMGVEWDVYKAPQYAMTRSGRAIKTGRYAVLRNDREGEDAVLEARATVDWNPHGHEETFNFFRDLADWGHMQLRHGGTLKDGRIIWVLAEVNDAFRLFGEDEVKSYFLFVNPHIYGNAIGLTWLGVRFSCWNALAGIMRKNVKDGSAIRVSHVKQFDEDRVKTMLGLAHKNMEEYKEAAEFLGSKPMQEKRVIKYLQEVFPSSVELPKEEWQPGKDPYKYLSRPGAEVLDCMDDQPGLEFGYGTWWQAYNATTYAVDHVMQRNADNRMCSAWLGMGAGNGAARKSKALASALKFARDA